MKPGKIIKTFKSKSGKEITLRHPKMDDVRIFLDYINTLSAENTFITMGGEKLTLKEEEDWLSGVLDKMDKSDMVHVAAFDGEDLVGTAAIERDMEGKTRSAHVGKFGLSVKKEYREDGIGRELVTIVLDLTKAKLDITIVALTMFEHNHIATKLYKSLGFEEFGRLPKGYLYKGAYSSQVYLYKRLD